MGVDVATIRDAFRATFDDRSVWPVALQMLGAAFASPAVLISNRCRRTSVLLLPETIEDDYFQFGFRDVDKAEYWERFRYTDPWAQAVDPERCVAPVRLSTLASRRTQPSHPFWNWLGARGMEDSFVACLRSSSTQWTALNVYLPQAQRQAGDDRDLRRFADLVPDIRQAYRFECLRSEADTLRTSLETALAHDRLPALVLSANGSIVASNARVEEPAVRRLLGLDNGSGAGVANLPAEAQGAWRDALVSGRVRLVRLAAENGRPCVMAFTPARAARGCASTGHDCVLARIIGADFAPVGGSGDEEIIRTFGLSDKQTQAVMHAIAGGKLADLSRENGNKSRSGYAVMNRAVEQIGVADTGALHRLLR